MVVDPGIHLGICPVGNSLGFGKKEENFIILGAVIQYQYIDIILPGLEHK